MDDEGEKTILIVPDAQSSDVSMVKPFTSRSFSLNRLFFPSSMKAGESLPVTAVANLANRQGQEQNWNAQLASSVSRENSVL